ncbi:hypothetical protein HPB47_025551 [Ixodes persulcatus]|uniref:Uncharacterized protein n=1 Tax=Ixodes persulcatus TaxID=34615 RepID=A0AC60Q309_IXOPE|nr:hypothetical protein HPB47_025551 [Ixodes persulcatus]
MDRSESTPGAPCGAEEEEETLLVFRDQVLGVVEAQRAAATARARGVVKTWVDSSGSRDICSQSLEPSKVT